MPASLLNTSVNLARKPVSPTAAVSSPHRMAAVRPAVQRYREKTDGRPWTLSASVNVQLVPMASTSVKNKATVLL